MTDFRASAEPVPIDSVDQLVEQFHLAGKPRAAWKIGSEYEKLAVDPATGRAIRFSGPNGIETLLRALAERFDWEPKDEDGRTIALSRAGASITLEPGGQVELSGAPFATLHETRQELSNHVRELVSVGRELGIAFLGLGIQPLSGLDDIEWVPKQRYRIMAPYMTKVGTLGQRMMKQTATVQVNIDYADERDAMRKLRLGQGIAPLVNAMFANSSIAEGRPTGHMSFRGHIWTDTDRARCGLLPFAFRADAGFADYVEWALDVPLYFILRNGRYVSDVTGIPFRRFMSGGRATLDDWQLHLTTLFPEVRLKSFIEFRSADSQPPERVLALPALVKGLCYETDCLDAAWDLVKRWGYEDVVELYRDVTREALLTRFRGIRVLEYARELYAIAEEGLRRQAARDTSGQDERVYLERLGEQLAMGRSPARVIAEKWLGEWDRRIDRLIAFAEFSA
jgi:glutamate--cysteine ligase